MSDAVHRIAPKRLVRGLTAAATGLGLAGGALALAMSAAPATGATAADHSPSVVASGPTSVRTGDAGRSWPYFACVAVYNYGICVGPPTS